MDLTSFQQLGIAGIAIGGVVTIFSIVSKSLLSELRKAREDYSSFVLSNNHNSTEMMTKNIETMVEVKNAMENHNKVLERILTKLE